MGNAIYFFRHKSIRRSCEGVGAGLFLVLATMILTAALIVSSCNNEIENEDEDPYPNNEIREEISSYLRESFLQWSQQASPSDVEAVMQNESSIFREFLDNAGYEDYLIDKFGNNNELALQLFDGLNDINSTEEDAFICREFLGFFDTYKTSAHIGYTFLTISIFIDYPLMVENVYNIVLEKYANTNHSTIPEDFNNTLQSTLIKEGKSGLPLGVIYGSCTLTISFNTITGKVSSVYFNNYVRGNYRMYDNYERSCYNIFWTVLWNAINSELKGTYAVQNIDLHFDGLQLNLHLTGYNPYKYKLIIYILVDGVWWIKPYYDWFYRVGFDIEYKINTVTGGLDMFSRLAAVMILPIDAEVDINNYSSTKAIAIEYKEISRWF